MRRSGFLVMLTSIIAGAAFASVSTVQGADTRLAIRGYDPVAYFIEARPMVGDPRFEQEWDGVTYRFASARHLELFKADPERYLPQYSNWCTASMSRGEKVVGEPENWLIHEGRLYLFGKPIGPGLMRQDPVAMKTRADGNWAKLAQDGPAIAPQ